MAWRDQYAEDEGTLSYEQHKRVRAEVAEERRSLKTCRLCGREGYRSFTKTHLIQDLGPEWVCTNEDACLRRRDVSDD